MTPQMTSRPEQIRIADSHDVTMHLLTTLQSLINKMSSAYTRLVGIPNVGVFTTVNTLIRITDRMVTIASR